MHDEQLDTMRHWSVTDLLAILRRWWWMFLPPIAIAIVIAVVFAMRAQPVYSAEAEVVIRTEESANLFPLGEVDMLRRSPSAEAGFLASTAFEVSAFEAAGSVGEVQVDVGDVNSRVEPSFISFQSSAPTPELAASVAQAWAETYIEMREDRDADDLLGTISTLESRLEVIETERAEHLAPVHALDRTLQTARDSGDVSRLSTQRLVLLQSVESTLAPLDEQAELVTGELAQLRLVEDFIGGGELSARVNRTAEAPLSPISPSLPRNIALALIIALTLGAGAVLLAETLDDRVRTPADISRRFGLQNLATVPFRRRDDQSPVPAPGPVAEAFHRLASAIDFCSITEGRAQVLVVTSAQASVSKTSTVSRLGATLARQGRRTLIIGADMRLPALGKRFGEASGPGLGELLGGLYPFSHCVDEIEGHEGLSILRAGSVATEASPVDLLRTDALGELIEELRPHYDHILIDSPPILPVVDALEILRVCDGVILSMFAGRSRFGRVERALSMLVQSSRKPILGFVLTGAKAEAGSYGGGYYGRESVSAGLVDLRPELPRPEPMPSVPSTASPAPTVVPSTVVTEPSQRWVQPVISGMGQTSMPSPRIQNSSIDEVEFLVEEEESDSVKEAVSPNEREHRRMRALRNLFVVVVALASLLSTAPAGAQYQGDSPETGILEVPTTVGDSSTVTFTHTGLEPNSVVTFVLESSDGETVDGIEVAGAVVVRADANGSYSGDITLPPGLADGIYNLDVSGTNADGSPYDRTFAINIGSGAVTDTGASALALTGVDSRRTAFNGVLIVAVGVMLVAFAARKRSPEAVSVDS